MSEVHEVIKFLIDYVAQADKLNQSHELSDYFNRVGKMEPPLFRNGIKKDVILQKVQALHSEPFRPFLLECSSADFDALVESVKRLRSELSSLSTPPTRQIFDSVLGFLLHLRAKRRELHNAKIAADGKTKALCLKLQDHYGPHLSRQLTLLVELEDNLATADEHKFTEFSRYVCKLGNALSVQELIDKFGEEVFVQSLQKFCDAKQASFKSYWQQVQKGEVAFTQDDKRVIHRYCFEQAGKSN